jgi:hypothetical protein
MLAGFSGAGAGALRSGLSRLGARAVVILLAGLSRLGAGARAGALLAGLSTGRLGTRAGASAILACRHMHTSFEPIANATMAKGRKTMGKQSAANE